MKLGVEDELDQDTLARTRIFPNGTQSKGDDIYKTTQSWTNRTQIENYMKDKLVEGESCNMFGIIQVQRSPGNIHISTHKRPLHVQASRQLSWVKHDIKSHEVHSLIFTTSLKHVLNEGSEIQDSFEQDENVFDRVKDYDLEVFKHLEGPQQILYYANIVPHTFVNPANSYEFNSYSYSINSNAKKVATGESILQFMYEFSPITMVVTKKGAESFGRFIVNICANVGGVFVIFGILNRAVTSIVTSLAK